MPTHNARSALQRGSAPKIKNSRKIRENELEFIYDKLGELQEAVKEKDKLLQFLENENQNLIATNISISTDLAKLKEMLLLGTKDLVLAAHVYQRIEPVIKNVAGNVRKLRLENTTDQSDDEGIAKKSKKSMVSVGCDLERSVISEFEKATAEVLSMTAEIDSTAERMMLVQAKNNLTIAKLGLEIRKEQEHEILRIEDDRSKLLEKVHHLELQLAERRPCISVNVAVMTEPMAEAKSSVDPSTPRVSFDCSRRDQETECDLPTPSASAMSYAEPLRHPVVVLQKPDKRAAEAWSIEREGMKNEISRLLREKGEESKRLRHEALELRAELQAQKIEMASLREKTLRLDRLSLVCKSESEPTHKAVQNYYNDLMHQKDADKTMDAIVNLCNRKEQKAERLQSAIQEQSLDFERLKAETSQETSRLMEELTLLRHENRKLQNQLRNNKLFELAVAPSSASCVLHQKQIETLEDRLSDLLNQLDISILREAKAVSERNVLAQETEDARQRYSSEQQEFLRGKAELSNLQSRNLDLQTHLTEAKAAVKLLQALIRRMSKRKSPETEERLEPSADQQPATSDSFDNRLKSLQQENDNLNLLLSQLEVEVIDREKAIEIVSREKQSLAQEVIRLRDNLAKLRALRILNSEFEVVEGEAEAKLVFKKETSTDNTNHRNIRKRLENSINELKKRLCQADGELKSFRGTNKLLTSAVARLEREKLILEDQLLKRKSLNVPRSSKNSKVKFSDSLSFSGED